MNASEQTAPFLKWAGGKRWLAPYIKAITPNFDRYIEPFLGSASVFFSIAPKQAILNDLNRPLIDTYIAIATNWELVWRYLKEHQKRHCTEYYYYVRDQEYKSPYTKAAQFIYLNRTCWNGLYRVNKNGKFNVPRGTKDSVILPDDNFRNIADVLKRTELLSKDFEFIIDRARSRDFVFVDPPYTIAHNKNGFLKYNKKLFDWSDQVRLKQSIDRAVQRGVKVLVANADHVSLRDLYSDYPMESIDRHSVIASDARHRRKSTELVVRCWQN